MITRLQKIHPPYRLRLLATTKSAFPDAGGQNGYDFILAVTVMATAGQIQWWGDYFSTKRPPNRMTSLFVSFHHRGRSRDRSTLLGDVGKVDSGLNRGSLIFTFTPPLTLDTTLVAGSYLLSIVE